MLIVHIGRKVCDWITEQNLPTNFTKTLNKLVLWLHTANVPAGQQTVLSISKLEHFCYELPLSLNLKIITLGNVT